MATGRKNPNTAIILWQAGLNCRDIAGGLLPKCFKGIGKS
jgi:hypothetical protein